MKEQDHFTKVNKMFKIIFRHSQFIIMKSFTVNAIYNLEIKVKLKLCSSFSNDISFNSMLKTFFCKNIQHVIMNSYFYIIYGSFKHKTVKSTKILVFRKEWKFIQCNHYIFWYCHIELLSVKRHHQWISFTDKHSDQCSEVTHCKNRNYSSRYFF